MKTEPQQTRLVATFGSCSEFPAFTLCVFTLWRFFLHYTFHLMRFDRRARTKSAQQTNEQPQTPTQSPGRLPSSRVQGNKSKRKGYDLRLNCHLRVITPPPPTSKTERIVIHSFSPPPPPELLSTPHTELIKNRRQWERLRLWRRRRWWRRTPTPSWWRAPRTSPSATTSRLRGTSAAS